MEVLNCQLGERYHGGFDQSRPGQRFLYQFDGPARHEWMLSTNLPSRLRVVVQDPGGEVLSDSVSYFASTHKGGFMSRAPGVYSLYVAPVLLSGPTSVAGFDFLVNAEPVKFRAKRAFTYFLVDCSESADDLSISHACRAISEAVHRLRHDPLALENIFPSVFAFASLGYAVAPCCELVEFQLPFFSRIRGEEGNILAGLTAVQEDLRSRLVPTTATTKGDWKASSVVVLTNGSCSAGWDQLLMQADSFRKGDWGPMRLSPCFVMTGEHPNESRTKAISDEVYSVQDIGESWFTRRCGVPLWTGDEWVPPDMD